jgi:hypothetical protein
VCIAVGGWQIEAHFPGAEIRYITGLTDKADIDDWMGGSRKIAWLRSQGFAKLTNWERRRGSNSPSSAPFSPLSRLHIRRAQYAVARIRSN